MPNKDGTGPAVKRQGCRSSGPKQGQRGHRDRKNRPVSGRRSRKSMRSGQWQGQGKKWQPNENQ